jgi:pilus assembly protein Flp/PilA
MKSDQHTPRAGRGKRDRGASLVEYALLLALLVVVCIGAVTLFGGATNDSLDRSGTSIVAN